MDLNLLNKVRTLASQSAYNFMRALSLDAFIQLALDSTVACNADKFCWNALGLCWSAAVTATWDEDLGIAGAVNLVYVEVLLLDADTWDTFCNWKIHWKVLLPYIGHWRPNSCSLLLFPTYFHPYIPKCIAFILCIEAILRLGNLVGKQYLNDNWIKIKIHYFIFSQWPLLTFSTMNWIFFCKKTHILIL